MYFDEDAGSGEGVLREIFSVFLEHFVMFNFHGSSQFATVVASAMQQGDFVPVARANSKPWFCAVRKLSNTVSSSLPSPSSVWHSK